LADITSFRKNLQEAVANLKEAVALSGRRKSGAASSAPTVGDLLRIQIDICD
jgi:hypothetical protein